MPPSHPPLLQNMTREMAWPLEIIFSEDLRQLIEVVLVLGCEPKCMCINLKNFEKSKMRLIDSLFLLFLKEIKRIIHAKSNNVKV